MGFETARKCLSSWVSLDFYRTCLWWKWLIKGLKAFLNTSLGKEIDWFGDFEKNFDLSMNLLVELWFFPFVFLLSFLVLFSQRAKCTFKRQKTLEKLAIPAYFLVVAMIILSMCNILSFGNLPHAHRDILHYEKV